MVFDDIARDLTGPRGPTETQFGYLNRSNRAEAQKVRALVEDWVSRYPEPHRLALISRLRSPIDDVHVSAFFELALHELLTKTGHKILAVEPTLQHTPRSPDFLVETPDGQPFYLEAVVATGKSAQETAGDARLNSAVHAIERAGAPAHFLDLHIEGKPDKPVTLRKLRRELQAWIAALPETEEAKDVAPFEYAEHGVKFEVKAFLRNTRATEPQRAIGAQSLEPYWATPGDGIRESVEKKSSRYGELDAPYVVAVNATGEFHNEEHALDALLGSPCVIVRRFDDGRTETEESRNPDGVWFGGRGARKLGLSAVISTERLHPWSVGQRRARLVRHPFAARPLPAVPLSIDEWNPQDGSLRKTAGASFAELLGLPPGWPEEG